ncbi:MAG: radical SAM family heme chaperone HemW [Pseudomonadota bacterium]
MLSLPPLSLYIHLPWCVSKCPYCDFNSHRAPDTLPEQATIDALMLDLELELPRVWGRSVHSVFIGGGTPSLFSAHAIEQVLNGVRARLPLAPHAEITLEANPGSVEHDRFEAYRAAGVNRISLGVQSFNNQHLQRLGRVHDGAQAYQAIESVQRAGFNHFNIDLMWALPQQRLDEALDDLRQALAFAPPHLSYYQLTVEPNTVFAAKPPPLPEEGEMLDIQEQSAALLEQAGYQPYEISAWSQPGRACQHNLNYWRFGDYIGIGAGASGKLTLPAEQAIVRTRRKKVPASWLKATSDQRFIAEQYRVPEADLPLEYMLNRTRLDEPIPVREFTQRTGLPLGRLRPALDRAEALGLVRLDEYCIHRTKRGEQYLNDLQALFLPD